jgi:hypothetical protein
MINQEQSTEYKPTLHLKMQLGILQGSHFFPLFFRLLVSTFFDLVLLFLYCLFGGGFCFFTPRLGFLAQATTELFLA